MNDEYENLLSHYNINDLTTDELFDIINLGGKSETETLEILVALYNNINREHLKEFILSKFEELNLCPNCGSTMVIRNPEHEHMGIPTHSCFDKSHCTECEYTW